MQKHTLTNKSSDAVDSSDAIELAARKNTRRFLFIQNISDVDMWFSFDGDAEADTAGSFVIEPNNSITFEGSVIPTNPISVIAASGTDKSVTCYEA